MRRVLRKRYGSAGVARIRSLGCNVSFREDDCRNSSRAGSRTTLVLRHVALNLMRRESESQAWREGQTQTVWVGNHSYLLQVLTG